MNDGKKGMDDYDRLHRLRPLYTSFCKLLARLSTTLIRTWLWMSVWWPPKLKLDWDPITTFIVVTFPPAWHSPTPLRPLLKSLWDL